MLRINQVNAIESSKRNNFSSGVHHHATGTGKSIIGLELIREYNTAYPKNNILWLCEQKSILLDQFSKQALGKSGYKNLSKSFLITNLTVNRPDLWWECIDQSLVWGKPILLIANRSFLTYSQNYKHLRSTFDIVIHDECHSITNLTTQQLYDWLYNKNPKIKFIGLSATPNLTDCPHLSKTISSYSILDALRDNVIVSPVIKWISCDFALDDIEVIKCFKKDILGLPRSKLIIWCGTIAGCKRLAAIWHTAFPNYIICLDTSDKLSSEWHTYQDFRECSKNAIMFCAGKHREGSDIPGLDGCVFLDGVSERSSRLFVQSVGRVVRKDLTINKQYGLIIDVRAKSPIEVSDRMNKYLSLSPSLFPWKYSFDYSIIRKRLIKHHRLELTSETQEKTSPKKSTCSNIPKNVDLRSLFIRDIPDNQNYISRVEMELSLIKEKNLESNILLAIEILNLTKNIPHVTRGSCGSSLVCYLLGISHVDPIVNDISFARFLNCFRDNLPDIDYDFPHFLRDEVFLRLQMKWPGCVARISNHVYYHEKSAIRQALRDNGVKGFIGKMEVNQRLRDMPKQLRDKIENDAKNLESTFRNYSLHCGGIVFFPDGIPDELVLSGQDRSMAQLIMNKDDIAKEQNFKIDILSSRALSQLTTIMRGKEIDFYANDRDPKTISMLSNGNNLGITLAESPLMRKAIVALKPKCIKDIAVCLAIIRPAAKQAKNCIQDVGLSLDDQIVFDDDAIQYIKESINCSEAEADKYRRAFSKGKAKWINEFKEKLLENEYTQRKCEEIIDKLTGLSRYGFCKAHAYSYAQLVWQLAYQKAHYPKQFWKAALSNCESFYRKWVHLYEACRVGLSPTSIMSGRPISLYAEQRRNNITYTSAEQQLRKTGKWNMEEKEFIDNCFMKTTSDEQISFRGIIASSRILNLSKDKCRDTVVVVFLGIGDGKYIEVLLKGNVPDLRTKIGVQGIGNKIKNNDLELESKFFKCF
jgi:hypothetical protein